MIMVKEEKKVSKINHSFYTKNNILLLSFVLICCFLFIRISYNGSKSDSVFHFLKVYIYKAYINRHSTSLESITKDLGLHAIIMIFIFISYILLSYLYKKWIQISINTLFFCYWIILVYSYSSYIDVKLYILTSIPFLLFLSIIYIASLRIPTSFPNKLK